ncbi:MAG TPA: acyl-CoA dehydrogenase family protein [Nocardioidaceae bacterium]|nr:acyl-CoA dehydrogenase family protein [Nocardioidaceae bacterium]
MDLTLTDDQAVIQSTARGLLAARASSADVRAVETEPAGYSAALWKEVVELGWPGLALPTDYDGVGEGFVELCLLVEELGGSQIPMPLLPTAAVCGIAIDRFGTEAQRAEWLADIAAGQVMTYALATARGGWAEPGRAVTALACDGGVALDGTAWFVPYAGTVDQLLVVARTSDDAPIVAVVAAADGVSTRRLDVVGPDPLYRVDLTDVSVATDRILGGVDGGADVVEAMTSHGAAATCAAMVGGAQRVLDMTVEHAKEREQFGQPIGSFQAVQHHCADMAIDLLTSRYLAYEAIWRLSEGLDAATEVAMAKAAVGDAYQRVVALGHQVHGAIGFTREHDLHRYLRHATAAALAFGDSDFHWDRLADRLVSHRSAQGPNSG